MVKAQAVVTASDLPSPAARERELNRSAEMALPAGFLDELRARTPLAAVVGRRVRLARSGRQWKGCCPFHGEKTPSFYVYEDGHYHCFGCGAHGDAIGFVMQSRGRRLHGGGGAARRRGRPGGAEALARGGRGGAAAARPASVLEAAQASYQRRLFLPEGRHALDYLRGRGLSERDDPPLRPRLVRRGPRRAGAPTSAATASPRTSSSRPD